MNFYTIGVYNTQEDVFFDKLKSNGIDLFCDIRQRRGVRGAKYAFVNSNRLQNKLKQIGINYLYVKDLAPTTQIRDEQKKADQQNGVEKRKRDTLGDAFVKKYNSDILLNFDFDIFLKELVLLKAENVVLFCVEEHHNACHRSLVAEVLNCKGYNIKHL